MRTTLIIPCFNEASRLDLVAFAAAQQATPDLQLVFVDDGSTDNTAATLTHFCAGSAGRRRWFGWPRNQGKGEAVRQGMLASLQAGDVVGYWDADLSTPLGELGVLRKELTRPGVDLVLGSRVALLGRQIKRHPWRHYLGRGFATAASLTLGLPVYDTQCGAKLFRATPQLARCLARPFETRWLFDLELMLRLREELGIGYLRQSAVEVPLRSWQEVPGSKLALTEAIGAGLQLVRLAWRRPPASARHRAVS